MRDKVFSLCISVQKIHQLKTKRSTVVSHVCSPMWERFYEKKLRKVRFFDANTLDNGVFIVKSVKKEVLLGETIIRINIGKEIK